MIDWRPFLPQGLRLLLQLSPSALLSHGPDAASSLSFERIPGFPLGFPLCPTEAFASSSRRGHLEGFHHVWRTPCALVQLFVISEVCLMAQDMGYLGVRSQGIWKRRALRGREL